VIKFVVTWIFKLAFQFVFWLFVFSIKINNKTIHAQSLEYINKNKILQSAGEKIEDLWYDFRNILSQSVGDASGDNQISL